jgi:hypothetical protein
VAIVPVLIESVVDVPFLLGVTEVEPNVIAPTPDGVGVSTLNVTGLPKFVFLFGAFWRVRVNVTVSPEFVASSEDAFEVIVKSRVTVPIWTANGVYFVVSYGAPAWPRSHRA